jgi:hypothetical protein
MINTGTVNGGGFQFLPAEICAILRVFAQKCALQKVR